MKVLAALVLVFIAVLAILAAARKRERLWAQAHVFEFPNGKNEHQTALFLLGIEPFSPKNPLSCARVDW